MTDSSILCDRIGKQYLLGEREAYRALRDVIAGLALAPYRQMRSRILPRVSEASKQSDPKSRDRFWALEDVSFDVKQGEVVGLIGRNGAGKSTLLKILSRITRPTRGHADIRGRVGSLLEVGTGFHPELTGRENVYLNGAILGMRRREIARKFDEIVSFAELERFIDTPVKRYSSGMYVRLAFAVAAHMETEVLIVDEVLAVGDAAFQKKSLGKMGDVSSQGRTVILVSHNTNSIARLCDRVIMLEKGRLIEDGDPTDVIRKYLSSGTASPSERMYPSKSDAPGDSIAKLAAVRVIDSGGNLAPMIDIRAPFDVEVQYWNLQSGSNLTAVIHFINEDGTCLFASNDFNNLEWMATPRTPGLVTARCRIPGNFLAEGRINVLAAVCSYNPNVVHAIEHDAVSFEVIDNTTGEGVRGAYTGAWPGVVRPMLQWTISVQTAYEEVNAGSELEFLGQ